MVSQLAEPHSRAVSRFADAAESAAIRDSMVILPRITALPLTLLTGKPQTGQKWLRFTPTTHLVCASLSLLTGLAIDWLALAGGQEWLLLLLPGWAMTLHGMRNLRMMIYHQAAHRNMWVRPRRDRAVGYLVAGTLMVQDFRRYSAEHIADHHAIHHMTVRDPTVQAFIVGLGMTPGMSRRDMWRCLIFARLLSPRFHAEFLLGRIQSYFRPASNLQRAVTITCYGALAAIVTWQGQWPFVGVAWLLPVTLFFQISNTLRLCVKHTFPAPGPHNRRSREYFAGLTNAIFLGERAPARGLGFIRGSGAWGRWALRTLLVHFPARYLVLTGDTVVHDYHHRRPMDREWANYIFARERDIASGTPGWPPYRAAWGLVPAIDAVFDSLRSADPAEYSRENITVTSKRSLFAAFDD
jgi:hypothetical protein